MMKDINAFIEELKAKYGADLVKESWHFFLGQALGYLHEQLFAGGYFTLNGTGAQAPIEYLRATDFFVNFAH